MSQIYKEKKRTIVNFNATFVLRIKKKKNKRNIIQRSHMCTNVTFITENIFSYYTLIKLQFAKLLEVKQINYILFQIFFKRFKNHAKIKEKSFRKIDW